MEVSDETWTKRKGKLELLARFDFYRITSSICQDSSIVSRELSLLRNITGFRVLSSDVSFLMITDCSSGERLSGFFYIFF